MLLRVAAWPLMEVGIGWSNLAGAIAVLVVFFGEDLLATAVGHRCQLAKAACGLPLQVEMGDPVGAGLSRN